MLKQSRWGRHGEKGRQIDRLTVRTDRQTDRHALTNNRAEPGNSIQVVKSWTQTGQGSNMRRGQKQKTRNSNTNTLDGWREEKRKKKGKMRRGIKTSYLSVKRTDLKQYSIKYQIHAVASLAGAYVSIH